MVDLGCGYIYVTGGMFADRTYIRYGETLPLVAICAAWRADQVLYGSCTIGIYNDDTVLCIFTIDYRSWRRSCKCFSDQYPQIRLRLDKKKDSEKPKTARTMCKACICPAICNIQFI